MPTHTSLPPVLIVVVAALLGCTDTKSNTPSTDSEVPASTQNDAARVDGVLKIAVMADGTIYVNSKTVPIDSLSSKLDEIGDVKEIWYHREAPEAAEPHENVMKVIAEIANRRLPVAMYLDRDFKQRVNLGGQ